MKEFDVKVMKSLEAQDDLRVGCEEHRGPDAIEVQKGWYDKSEEITKYNYYIMS